MICTNTDHYVNSLSTTKKKKTKKKKTNSYPATGTRIRRVMESAATRIQPPEFEFCAR